MFNKKSSLRNDRAMPYHLAIIMDGNGRWARRKLMPRTMGHRAGMVALKRIVKACDELGISILTVYAFSTENWKRPATEVQYLMNLLVEFLHKELAELHENQVKINIFGDYRVLNRECQDEIEQSLLTTRANQGLVFNIALNYGSRMEIADAVRGLAAQVLKGDISPDDINEESIEGLLYTKGMPDPDLLIRTAGEMRLSNFMLWQLAYTEIWVTECLWPDFGRDDLLQAIADYQQRDRRFGALSKLEEGVEPV